jgi:hypothetical protein
MSDEKLDTQNGIRNKRMVCHRSALREPWLLTLRSSATPTTALIPTELSQMAGDRSK